MILPDDELFLEQCLYDVLKDINEQIMVVDDIARKMKIAPREVRNSTGEFMLTPLLLAKANALLALSNLK